MPQHCIIRAVTLFHGLAESHSFNRPTRSAPVTLFCLEYVRRLVVGQSSYLIVNPGKKVQS